MPSMPPSFEGIYSHCNFLDEENVPSQLSVIVWLDVNNGGPSSCWWWWNIWGPTPSCCGNSDAESRGQWPLTASAHCVSFPCVSRTCTSLAQLCRQRSEDSSTCFHDARSPGRRTWPVRALAGCLCVLHLPASSPPAYTPLCPLCHHAATMPRTDAPRTTPGQRPLCKLAHSSL